MTSLRQLHRSKIAIGSNMQQFGDRLGWLVDADNFYRKLSAVRRCLARLHRKTKV